MSDLESRGIGAGHDTLVTIDVALAVLKSQGWTAEKLLLAIYRRENIIMAQLTDLLAAVATDTQLTDAVLAALGEFRTDVAALQAEVADLQAQLAAAGSPVDLSGVIASVQAIDDKLAAATAPPA